MLLPSDYGLRNDTEVLTLSLLERLTQPHCLKPSCSLQIGLNLGKPIYDPGIAILAGDTFIAHSNTFIREVARKRS